MGLTAQDELSLSDAGLTAFFEHNMAGFKALAARSYAFTRENVQPTGLPLRRDDVAGNLAGALEINEGLREFLAEKKLRQKFWYRRFADLVLDRLWEELGHAPKQKEQ